MFHLFQNFIPRYYPRYHPQYYDSKKVDNNLDFVDVQNSETELEPAVEVQNVKNGVQTMK